MNEITGRFCSCADQKTLNDRPDVCTHIGAHKPFCFGIRYDRMLDMVVAVTGAQATAGIADESCRCCGKLRRSAGLAAQATAFVPAGWPAGGLEPMGNWASPIQPYPEPNQGCCGQGANGSVVPQTDTPWDGKK